MPHMKNSRMPQAAVNELDAILRLNPFTPGDELEKVLIKHNVTGDPGKLQARDRKARIQRFSARYRDKDGCRDVLAHLDKESKHTYYVTIENCTDISVLDEIGHRLNSNIAGLRACAKKVAHRRDMLLLLSCGYVIRRRPSKRPENQERRR